MITSSSTTPGGYLAALITHYAFCLAVSLLLLLATVLSWVLSSRPDLPGGDHRVGTRSSWLSATNWGTRPHSARRHGRRHRRRSRVRLRRTGSRQRRAARPQHGVGDSTQQSTQPITVRLQPGDRPDRRTGNRRHDHPVDPSPPCVSGGSVLRCRSPSPCSPTPLVLLGVQRWRSCAACRPRCTSRARFAAALWHRSRPTVSPTSGASSRSPR